MDADDLRAKRRTDGAIVNEWENYRNMQERGEEGRRGKTRMKGGGGERGKHVQSIEKRKKLENAAEEVEEHWNEDVKWRK